MEAVERVGIKNLKNNLSAYIRRVKRGVRVLVTDREVVVAELRLPADKEEAGSIHPLLSEWIRSGKVIPPRTRSRRAVPPSPIKSRPGTSRRLLDQVRGE